MYTRIFNRPATALVVVLAVTLAGVLFPAPAAFANPQSGIDAYTAGDPVAATKAWVAAAGEGDATSAYLAAKMYEGGQGVVTQPKRVVRYLTQAAEAGHIQAQVELGDYYRSGFQEGELDRDPTAALQWYEKAALYQHAEAQSKIGELYFTGEGVQRNRYEAIRWYSLAARKYYTPALVHLANIYWESDAVVQDKPRAYSYLLLALEASTEATRPGVGAVMRNREKNLSRAEIETGVRLAEAFRLEYPKR